MLSDNDKQILNKLKDEYPEAYELFERREEEHRRLLKQGCHDIRNIVTLLSGSYQLLGLTNPQLNSIPRYVTMDSDIKNLVKAFNDVAMFRYAAAISPSDVHIYDIKSMLDTYISNNLPTAYPDINIICACTNDTISLDASRLVTAVGCMIANAVEASDSMVPIDVIMHCDNDNSLDITVQNHGGCPAPDMADIMFTPFSTDKQEHLGLGLAIAAETANAMGGSISWSHSDGLTSFTISVKLTGSKNT